MAARRNSPPLNPNGTKFRGVRVFVPRRKSRYRTRGKDGVYTHQTEYHDRHSPEWRRMMKVVYAYQAAGFWVRYTEKRQAIPSDRWSHADTYRGLVADVDISPEPFEN